MANESQETAMASAFDRHRRLVINRQGSRHDEADSRDELVAEYLRESAKRVDASRRNAVRQRNREKRFRSGDLEELKHGHTRDQGDRSRNFRNRDYCRHPDRTLTFCLNFLESVSSMFRSGRVPRWEKKHLPFECVALVLQGAVTNS
jgi:hypothetical protein